MKKLPILKSPCDGCGECCKGQESPPGYVGYLPGAAFRYIDCPDRNRVEALPTHLVNELKAYVERLLAGRKPPHPTHPACLWYDAQSTRCRHHELRPSICRDFQVGSADCNRYRMAVGLPPLKRI